MRRTLLIVLTSCALPALAQEGGAGSQAMIVVTGTPLAATEAKLAACLARRCPPKEDIDASIAHAENLFIAGDYAGARRTLGKARGRNSRHAETLPTEVADLNRAYGRMANVDGRPDLGRLAQIESLEALKSGLGDNDERVFMQRLTVGDEFARAGRLHAAEDVYRRVARQARKARQLRIMGFALLRDAVVHAAVATVDPSFTATAKRKIARVENSAEPELAEFRTAARLLLAQLASHADDPAELERAIAALPPQSGGKPVLVHAPAIDLPENLGKRPPSDLGKPEWIDLRFWITAAGTVREVETLRTSGSIHGDWPERVEAAVAKRRYVPLALDPGSEGPERIERFSMVHDVMYETGSRIAGRSGYGRIASLDITPDLAN